MIDALVIGWCVVAFSVVGAMGFALLKFVRDNR